MPLYEYRCQNCDHPFEVLQAIGAHGQGLTCPSCQSASVAKQLSTFAATSAEPSRAASPAGCCRGTPT